jgi:hypothetical protein
MLSGQANTRYNCDMHHLWLTVHPFLKQSTLSLLKSQSGKKEYEKLYEDSYGDVKQNYNSNNYYSVVLLLQVGLLYCFDE